MNAICCSENLDFRIVLPRPASLYITRKLALQAVQFSGFRSLLFNFGDRLVDRMGVWRLYLAAGVAGILRWTVLASSTAVPVLVAVQSLHALTFAATHMASIAFIVRYVPRDQSATAQGVYDGMAMGFVFGLGMAAAGWIYELHGQAVFLLSAGFSAVGVLGALLMRWRG